jgi:hypothetical protein
MDHEVHEDYEDSKEEDKCEAWTRPRTLGYTDVGNTRTVWREYSSRLHRDSMGYNDGAAGGRTAHRHSTGTAQTWQEEGPHVER